MIETDDLSEGLVLTVQTRQEALRAAAQLVCEIPATLLDGSPPDVVLKYAKKFEAYLQNGRVQ